MRARRRLTIALLGAVSALVAFTLVAAPAVAASSVNPAIQDCLTHPGGLTGSYTVQQLRHALQVMPAETKEYTSCSDVINRALLSAIGREHESAAGASSGGSGSILPTPVVIVLVVLGLAAITFAALAVRRRRAPGA